MKKEVAHRLRFIRNEDVETLPAKKPIGITATATTERRSGESVIRFAFGDENDHPRELFRKFSPWHKLQQRFAVEVGDEPLIKPCSLRECSFDAKTETLYISIYTPVSAEKVLDWF